MKINIPPCLKFKTVLLETNFAPFISAADTMSFYSQNFYKICLTQIDPHTYKYPGGSASRFYSRKNNIPANQHKNNKKCQGILKLEMVCSEAFSLKFQCLVTLL